MHYHVYDRPAGCVCTENPARFTWIPPAGNDAPCRIEVRREGQPAYSFEGIDCNFFTPDCVMAPGAYTYRVFAGEEEFVPEKAFSIAEDAVHTGGIKASVKDGAIIDEGAFSNCYSLKKAENLENVC